jgi:hypothetical protein
MYEITNSQRAEITKLLAALTKIPGIDSKTADTRRRAKNAIGKLAKARKLPPVKV